MSIKAITFDFWQTLYQNRPFDFEARLRQMQADLAQSNGATLSIDTIKAAVKVARDAWSEAWVKEHRTLTADEWLTVMLGHLGISIKAADKRTIQTRMETSVLEAPPILVDDALAVVPKLANRYRLAIISDTGITPGWVLRQILEKDNLVDYFSHLTFSDEVGRSKPHPDAFLTTLKALQANPNEAVHVGDLLRTDVAGAKNVGMRGVQYVGINKDEWAQTWVQPPSSPVEPDAVISDHAELLPLLQQWRNGSS